MSVHQLVFSLPIAAFPQGWLLVFSAFRSLMKLLRLQTVAGHANGCRDASQLSGVRRRRLGSSQPLAPHHHLPSSTPTYPLHFGVPKRASKCCQYDEKGVSRLTCIGMSQIKPKSSTSACSVTAACRTNRARLRSSMSSARPEACRARGESNSPLQLRSCFDVDVSLMYCGRVVIDLGVDGLFMPM